MKKNMNKTTKNNFITYGMVIAIFVVVQILSSTGNLSRLLTGLLVPICVYIIASLSLNLVVGYSGELSLGHAGFMCVGAYSSALFSHVTSDVLPSVPRLILALLVGAAVAAVFGVLIGIPVLRLRGDYLAIVTLAFGEIMVLVVLFIIQNLVNSRSGRAITSTRDNRIAAESIGINVTKNKLLAFTISAAIAGVAGVLYAHNLSMLKVSIFDYNMSITILVYVILGGMGNLRGSILATIVLYALPELLRGFSTYRMLIYAIVMITMMLFNWAPAARDFRSRIIEKIKGHVKEKEAA